MLLNAHVLLLNALLLLLPVARAAVPSVTICRDAGLRDCRSLWVLERVAGYCMNLNRRWDNAVSSYAVESACCAFYADKKCVNELWVAENRREGSLPAGRDNAVSSYKCALDCAGLAA